MDQSTRTTSPQPVIPSQTPPTSRNLVPLVIVAVVAALLASGGTYFVMSSNQNKQEQMSYQQPTSTQLSPTQAVITPESSQQASDWRTYTNNNYGYTVNYPKSSTLKEYTDEKSPYTNLVNYVSIDINTGEQFPIPFWVRVWKDLGIKITDVSSYDRWCTELMKQNSKEQYSQLGCDTGATQTQVNGYNAFKTSGGRDNSFVEKYLIPQSGYVYEVELVSYTGDPQSPKRYPISSEILSTFKITK